MVDVNSLTDDELRTKLVEYGFPVMPITGTTRALMTKKLKLLMESKEKPTSDRRSLAKFSSDEEDNAEVKASKKDKRRVTMAVPPMQQAKVTINVEDKNEMVPPAAPVQKEKNKPRSTKITVKVHESPDTNSDSEPEFIDEYTQSYEIKVPLKKKSSPVKQKEPTPPPKPQESISTRKTISSSSSSSASRYTAFSKPSEELEKMRARLSLGSTTKKDYFADVDVQENSDGDAPFLSNFTRRLSQMSPRNGATGGDYDTSSTLYSRSNYSSRPRGREYAKPAYSTALEAEATKSSSSNISVILIAALVLFFIVLAALYYGLHSGNEVSAISGKTPKYEPLN